MNKKSHQRCKVFNLHLNKLFISLISIVVVLTTSIASVSASNPVKGTVTDEKTNSALIGVSVLVEGTKVGTITDFNGNYSIEIPSSNSTLVFSYIGYSTKKVNVNGQTNLNVILSEDTKNLDEVIVVGYGVQKKSVVSAAISRVSAEDLSKTTPSRIEDALKGKISGVQITQSSGQPGSDSKVRIRGVGTVNNSDPLYIVDGMAVDGGITYLNPADIQSVEVLKDAAAGAIYGARAANGVILVTTKGGTIGKASINYDFTYGLQNPWKKKSVLNATEYMTLMNESAINDGNSPKYTNAQILAAGKGTDWQDKTFNYDAPIQNHQVSVNGGTDKGTYFLSFGYFDQQGIVGGNYGKSNYKRYSLRSNTTYTVFDAKDRSFLNNLRIGSNISYSKDISSGIETNSEYGSVLGSALAFDPTIPVYATDPAAVLAAHPNAVKDKNGNVYSIPPAGFQEIANPVAMLDAPTKSTSNDDKFVSSFWAELNILNGLKFKTSYGTDLAFWGTDGYTFQYFLATQGKDITQSSVTSEMHRGFTWQVENTLTYTKKFNTKHNLTLLLGQSAKKNTLRELSGQNFVLLETNPEKANINSAIADQTLQRVQGGTGGYNFRSLASYFGRFDYNYAERYMIQATVRRDGSSNFGPNNKWAIFPSVSVGWNITNESFLEKRPEWFSNFKFRGSWGKNGNENIPAFGYTSLMDGNQNYYFGSGATGTATASTMQYGSSPSRIANPNLKWEESEQLDLGFDARFINNSLTFGFDYFNKKTNGMLMYQPIPDYVGKGAPWANIGDMKNSGLEFEIGYKLKAKDFTFNVSANASYIKNELIKLGNASGEAIYADAGASGVGSYVKGKNGDVYPYFYGYKTDGILQTQAQANAYNTKYGENAQPGDVIFKDIAGALDANGNSIPDNKITDADKTKIGKGMPDWTFGLNLGAEWKGFDLTLFFQGTQGNDIFDFSQRGDIQAMNRPSWMLGRWIGEGTSNRIPRMTAVNPNRNWRSSDLYIKDGSYIRLKTIQLGYTLPSQLMKKVSIQKLRLFVTAENLLTFTKYDGFDPEIAAGDNYFNIGVDKGIYPQSRTISVGANISF